MALLTGRAVDTGVTGRTAGAVTAVMTGAAPCTAGNTGAERSGGLRARLPPRGLYSVAGIEAVELSVAGGTKDPLGDRVLATGAGPMLLGGRVAATGAAGIVILGAGGNVAAGLKLPLAVYIGPCAAMGAARGSTDPYPVKAPDFSGTSAKGLYSGGDDPKAGVSSASSIMPCSLKLSSSACCSMRMSMSS